ncbi:MAG: hypothetical protein HYZ90_01600 [Candidatus Omnitrophica bacterium]|nr:hypothetical protein [Candidatus Omnitrophota bacterium]
MNRDRWERWVENWFSRHPVKEPPALLERAYPEEVMEKIRAAQTDPSPLWRRAFKPSFALGTALAGMGILFLWANLGPHWEEAAFIREADLKEEARELDRLTLAQAAAAHAQEDLEETVDLLEAVESDGSVRGEENPLSGEEWLQELRELDEMEIASS